MLKIYLKEDYKILAISDIHEHPAQFEALLEKWQPSRKRIVVIVGDIIDKGFGYAAFSQICSKIRKMSEAKTAYFIKGNHELKALRKAKKLGAFDKNMDWLNKQPISMSCYFPNNKRYTFVHAGITPKMEEKDLDSNLDVCYCRGVDSEGKHVESRFVDNKWQFIKPATNWHKLYDGRFGYVVSGHQPLYSGKPEFYEYSCDIDTACFKTGILTGLIISQDETSIIQVGEHSEAFEYDPSFSFENEFP